MKSSLNVQSCVSLTCQTLDTQSPKSVSHIPGFGTLAEHFFKAFSGLPFNASQNRQIQLELWDALISYQMDTMCRKIKPWVSQHTSIGITRPEKHSWNRNINRHTCAHARKCLVYTAVLLRLNKYTFKRTKMYTSKFGTKVTVFQFCFMHFHA